MKFYILEHPVGRQSKYETDYYPENPVYDDAPKCPTCGVYTGPRVWRAPYRIELRYWKSRYAELICSFSDLVVAERLVELSLQQGLTGLIFLGDAEIVKVVPKKMASGMPKYIVARPQRSKTEFDLAASGVVYQRAPTCPECRLGNNLIKLDRVALVESSWDGSDVFIARGLPGFTIVSQGFHDFCMECEIKNAFMIPASEYKHDYSWVDFGEAV